MKTILVLVLLCTFVFSQNYTPYFVGLSVKDINESAKWYKKYLNMDVKFEKDDKKYKVKFNILSNDKMTIELLQFYESSSLKDATKKEITNLHTIRKIAKFGFLVEDLDKTFKMFESSDVKVIIKPMKDPNLDIKFFIIQDLDEHMIQFFQKV